MGKDWLNISLKMSQVGWKRAYAIYYLLALWQLISHLHIQFVKQVPKYIKFSLPPKYVLHDSIQSLQYAAMKTRNLNWKLK